MIADKLQRPKDIITKTNKTFTMDSSNIQLELEEYSITLKIQALQGVLTSKTFHGEDCYLQLIGFMKEAFSRGSTINATIFVREPQETERIHKP